MEYKTLDCVPEGRTAKITALHMQDAMRRRLMDLGLIEGTTVLCIQTSPLGDPAAYSVRGAVIALRREDASKIAVEV